MSRRASLTLHSRRITPVEVARNWIRGTVLAGVFTDEELEDMDWGSPEGAQLNCAILEIPKSHWPDICHGIGAVYFIYSPVMKAIKIGFSFNPAKRIKGLQTGSPEKLETLAIARGTKADERALHKSFASIRLRGEWFKDRAHLRKYIAGLVAP